MPFDIPVMEVGKWLPF